MSILIIEDEKKLVEILKRSLKGERYSVDVSYDGEDGLKKALKNKYDIIILDIMLPKMDGFAVCREIRRHEIHTPIIMLTARSSSEDKVTGLDIGADDYLVKPFGIDELIARIRTVLRRKTPRNPDIHQVANLILDRNKHEVTRGGKILSLTPKEYKILDTLISHKGEAVSRRELIDNAWGPEFMEGNNELNVHIKYLRNKVDSGKNKALIHTIRGVGFVIKE